MKNLLVLTCAIFILTITNPLYGSTIYNDPNNTDWLNPSQVMIQEGSNIITGTLIQDGFCPDFYTLIIPEGIQITALNVIDYVTVPDNTGGSFLGMQPGPTLSTSPFFLENPPIGEAPDPINNILINTASIGEPGILNQLTLGAPLNGVQTLESGSYALWLNEIATGASYEIDFVAEAVPEPSSATLLTLTALFIGFHRRRTK